MEYLPRNSVWIAEGTSVEIVRNAFPARVVFKGSTLASNREERHEAGLVQVARWILGRMVGHHAGREGIAGWGDENAGELGEEEIGVCSDGAVELCLAEGKESCVLFRSRLDSY